MVVKGEKRNPEFDHLPDMEAPVSYRAFNMATASPMVGLSFELSLVHL